MLLGCDLCGYILLTSVPLITYNIDAATLECT